MIRTCTAGPCGKRWAANIDPITINVSKRMSASSAASSMFQSRNRSKKLAARVPIALHHEASRDPHRDASNFGVVTST